MSDSSMRSLFIAEANQNAFRINCFADGLGVMLDGILPWIVLPEARVIGIMEQILGAFSRCIQ